MNLSIYQIGYLGSQAKDTPHSGKSKILTLGHARFLEQVTDTLWLQQLGIGVQNEWPLARWLWTAESAENDTLSADQDSLLSGSLLLVQPVYLSLQRDSFALEGLVKLSAGEYNTLTDLLNQFFAEEQLQFLPSHTQQYWFLKTPHVWQLQTHFAQAALQRNIQRYMPTGADAQRLRQIMNQVQMLMHEHPINQQRAQHGLAEANSVWFSGVSADTLPPTSPDIKLVKSPVTLQSSIKDINEVLQQGVQSACMLVEDDSIVDWDTIYDNVRFKKIQRLDCYWPVAQGTLQVTLTSSDRWKLWRKPRTIASLVAHYVQTH